MPSKIPYASKTADARGYYSYSAEDHSVWAELFDRQMQALRGRFVPAFLEGVEKLGLTRESVPQVVEIDARLNRLTGAGVHGVPAIIPPKQYFDLLAARKFPVATFLRRREDIDYIEEPDLFHEVFGHCPLLTDPAYCEMFQTFGKQAQGLRKMGAWHLFRLFWFTVEFGMISTPKGPLPYGAGIASSPSELDHATSDRAELRPFDLAEVLRTPYRIDILQPVYFVIDSFDQLAELFASDLEDAIRRAQKDGDLPPRFDQAA